MSLFSMSVILFLIMNAIGQIRAFIAVLERVPEQQRRSFILQESLFALTFLLLFYAIGGRLLSILEIQPAVVQAAGGLVLFIKALKMIFPHLYTLEPTSQEGKPWIVPMATPLLASPGAMSLMLLWSCLPSGSMPSAVGAIVLACGASVGVVFLSFPIKRLIGQRGLNAIERLMGLLLLLLAIEMMLAMVTFCMK